MKKIFIFLLFLVSCAPSVFVTTQGLNVTRYFAGPTPPEVEAIAKLAEESGLCRPAELDGVVVKIYPTNELYGVSSFSEKACGVVNKHDEVIIAGRCDFSCRTLLHELTHICLRRRGVSELDHDDKSIWTKRKQLRGEYVKEVAKICP